MYIAEIRLINFLIIQLIRSGGYKFIFEGLIELDKLSCMAKKSRNNRHKTIGKFTTNPTQYILLCNPAKYDHTYDQKTGLITVKNKRQDRVIGVFDYSELNEYLGVGHNSFIN
jgi:hypothetical protein